jgi:hypothetical protein
MAGLGLHALRSALPVRALRCLIANDMHALDHACTGNACTECMRWINMHALVLPVHALHFDDGYGGGGRGRGLNDPDVEWYVAVEHSLNDTQ